MLLPTITYHDSPINHHDHLEILERLDHASENLLEALQELSIIDPWLNQVHKSKATIPPLCFIITCRMIKMPSFILWNWLKFTFLPKHYSTSLLTYSCTSESLSKSYWSKSNISTFQEIVHSSQSLSWFK